MRLEEWQKYIESQFLEPEANQEPHPEAETSPPAGKAEETVRDGVEAGESRHATQGVTPSRRTPVSRARHAHDVRPEMPPADLSAAERWAAIPDRLQTLLALERMEEREIAQYSYKRPFQEKRRELIERLLDPVLSLEETARLLNVCPTTVRRYTNKGILPHYRKEPEGPARERELPTRETRQRRFRLSDILAFLQTQQAAVAADRLAEDQRRRKAAEAREAGDQSTPATMRKRNTTHE